MRLNKLDAGPLISLHETGSYSCKASAVVEVSCSAVPWRAIVRHGMQRAYLAQIHGETGQSPGLIMFETLKASQALCYALCSGVAPLGGPMVGVDC